MNMYQMTDKQREEFADHIKATVVERLVENGLLKKDIAENWCLTHTVIVRNKSFFRTITDKWRKQEVKDSTEYWLVVGQNEHP